MAACIFHWKSVFPLILFLPHLTVLDVARTHSHPPQNPTMNIFDQALSLLPPTPSMEGTCSSTPSQPQPQREQHSSNRAFQWMDEVDSLQSQLDEVSGNERRGSWWSLTP